MKIRDLLSDPTLQQKKILEKLVCHYCGISKEEIFTSYEKEISKEQYDAIIAWYNAYTKDKKPLEFILWFVEFFQRKFAVDGRCLIPRPETEYMIQGVNEHIQRTSPTTQDALHIQSMDGQFPDKVVGKMSDSASKGKNILIDVWTGCGVLGLSVLLENPWFFAHAYLTEYYPDTLSLASENAEKYNSDLLPKPILIQANLVDFLQNKPYKTICIDKDITLVANLPYIPDETFDTQTEDTVRKWEPRVAFVWGDDWLNFYRAMFLQLFETGLKMTMFLEMMTRQVDILRTEFWKKIDFEEIKTFHFNIRIVKGVVK